MIIGLVFLSALISAPNSNAIFIHRKSNPSADMEIIRRIHSHPQSQTHYFRIFDFNLGPISSHDEVLTLENIIFNPSLPNYFHMSTEVRSAIFASFLNSLISKPAQLAPHTIHIDHHYDLPSLKSVSTTVLVTDLVLCLNSTDCQKLMSEENIRRARNLLADSIPVLDHSDADIMLSHFVMNHARSAEFITRHQQLLKGVALYNDYQLDFSTSDIERRAIRNIFLCMLGLEKQLQHGNLSIDESMPIISAVFDFFASHDLTEEAAAAQLQRDPQHRFSPAFLAAYDRIEKKHSGFRQILGDSPLRQFKNIYEMSRGDIGFIDDLIVFYTPSHRIEWESSVTVEYLLKHRPDEIQKAKAVLLITENPQSHAWFIKIRSIEGAVDLDKLWKKLRKQSLDPGGRSQAGEAAYGKSGRGAVSEETLKADANKVIRTFQNTFSCKSGLKKFIDGLKNVLRFR